MFSLKQAGLYPWPLDHPLRKTVIAERGMLDEVMNYAPQDITLNRYR